MRSKQLPSYPKTPARLTPGFYRLYLPLILSAHWLAHLPMLDAQNQSSGFLASHLKRQKVKDLQLFAKILKSDPRKNFQEFTSDAHRDFLKIETIRLVNKPFSLDQVTSDIDII